MLIKKLVLKNIRSYIEETITFPQGIVLLAGDIGSGKSTILLAIEFALFGLLRSELSGTSLLRHGAKEGSVELTFALKGQEYVIRRALKRSRDSVEQNAGWLITNGTKHDLTATELKSRILDLLGYPADLLTKNKSLIFRYTVYTPQEEMKRILFEDSETRLNILRRVFNIDKYKRIKENAALYARTLRERKRALDAVLADEPHKQGELAKLENEHVTLAEQLAKLSPALESARTTVAAQRRQLEQLEHQRARFAECTQKLASCTAERAALLSQHQRLQEERRQCAEKLAKLQPESILESPDAIARAIARQDETIRMTEQELRKHSQHIGEILSQKRVSETLAQKISGLHKCPVCLQDVREEHKHAIKTKEAENAEALAKQAEEKQRALADLEQQHKKLRDGLDQLRQKHLRAAQAALRQQQYAEAQQSLARITAQTEQFTADIARIEARHQELQAGLQEFSSIEPRILAAKNAFDQAMQNERETLLEHTRLVEQHRHAAQFIQRLKNELAEKEKARAQRETLTTHHAWLAEHFTALMDTMEKHVLARVWGEFNDLFRRWLALLVEDEILTARLDDTFTPFIQQNGYDVEYASLSGGEKTACALAYRLALNRVITDLIDTIHTQDIIILDEPTDGFSADQLDRMRDVLEQLNCRQTVLVSHETKIESMVDHVIRITKDAHVSRVLA